MTPDEIRLECLKLSVPRDIANPDTETVLQRAKAFEAYVIGDGQGQKPPSDKPTLSLAPKTGQGQSAPGARGK